MGSSRYVCLFVFNVNFLDYGYDLRNSQYFQVNIITLKLYYSFKAIDNYRADPTFITPFSTFRDRLSFAFRLQNFNLKYLLKAVHILFLILWLEQ